MKKIVIIGANDFQNQLIVKAKDMGYETHVFAWKDGSIGERTADLFYPISIIDKEQILEECKKINPDAIASIASDLAVVTVTYVASKLGLTCNSLDSVLKCTNKYEMRKSFKKSNIPTPAFLKVSENANFDIASFKYPLIIKPTDRSGSRGVTKILEEKEIDAALKNAISNSFEKKSIIEEYIDGEEYSCECISFNGNHNFLSLTKKLTTGAPNFIETAHIQPSDIPKETDAKIIKIIFAALDSLGIKNGASHSEFKLDANGNIGIIEIGARMGGDCIGSDLVKISTGYDFLKMTIDVAMGKEPIMEKVCSPKIAVVKFIFDKKDLDDLEIIKSNFPTSIYRIGNIENYNAKHKVVDSSTRLGYYILACNDRNDAFEVLGL